VKLSRAAMEWLLLTLVIFATELLVGFLARLDHEPAGGDRPATLEEIADAIRAAP
jgi:hypothetical protein